MWSSPRLTARPIPPASAPRSLYNIRVHTLTQIPSHYCCDRWLWRVRRTTQARWILCVKYSSSSHRNRLNSATFRNANYCTSSIHSTVCMYDLCKLALNVFKGIDRISIGASACADTSMRGILHCNWKDHWLVSSRKRFLVVMWVSEIACCCILKQFKTNIKHKYFIWR